VQTGELLTFRELLWNLTLRELRTKYRRSFLGWTWSLINPLATMAIFTFIFVVVFDAQAPVGDPSGLKSYPLYLLAGLIPWNFFAGSVATAMTTIVANGTLVRKVYFPREALVFATVASMLVSLLIELAILSVVFLFAGNMVLPWIPVALVLTVVLAAFTTGLALLLAALYVFFRDLSHLWAILSQAWFYLTPIVYPISLVPERLEPFLELNPMTLFAGAYRDLLYNLRFPPLDQLAYLVVISGAMLAVGLTVFRRSAYRFAEEL
jgi:ABC-type polysaccharide/polyol phosphate export permease